MPKKKTVFFDRDGVLVKAKISPDGKKHYAPKKPERVEIIGEAVNVVKKLKENGFLVIVVSNQPDVALGKIDERTKDNLEKKFVKVAKEKGLEIDDVFYCYHHEESINLKYPKDCDCRKPKPGLINEAAKKWAISIHTSFLIGDTWRDVEAGKRAGVKTILLMRSYSMPENCTPDFTVDTLPEAYEIVQKATYNYV